MEEDNTFQEDAMAPDDLRTKYGWSLSTQKRARDMGQFPPGYRIGARLLWRKSTVDSWMAEQEADAKQQGSRPKRRVGE